MPAPYHTGATDTPDPGQAAPGSITSLFGPGTRTRGLKRLSPPRHTDMPVAWAQTVDPSPAGRGSRPLRAGRITLRAKDPAARFRIFYTGV